jgi:hypothetical protein
MRTHPSAKEAGLDEEYLYQLRDPPEANKAKKMAKTKM